MKIEFESDLQMGVSFNTLKNMKGGKIDIYYFSGERYQYAAEWLGKGMGNITFAIYDENGEQVTTVNVTGETDEEKEIINMSVHHSRNKETDQFLFIPFEMIHSGNNFQQKRNF